MGTRGWLPVSQGSRDHVTCPVAGTAGHRQPGRVSRVDVLKTIGMVVERSETGWTRIVPTHNSHYITVSCEQREHW